MSQHKVVLLLGSNIGDKKNNINLALEDIKKVGTILKMSEYLTSEPEEFVSCNNFCNIATIIGTHLSPIRLLNFVKEIEKSMGRINDSRMSGGYTDRIIDIDIIKFNELNFSSKRLEIPHKKNLFEREFSKTLLKKLI